MPALLNTVDPDGLLEYSVVFTDRSLNHMSAVFQGVMRDISAAMREVYHADGVAIVPGGGTYGMEAVARQFANDQDIMVIRNGWFSYRWTQIFEAGKIPSRMQVMLAQRAGNHATSPFAPCPLDEVLAKIAEQKPAVVFAPHVETASGIILSDDYISAVAKAVHSYGGLLVLDCIASGCIWVDMKALGIDVVISAPQKSWSSSPSAGLVMLSERALARIAETQSSSFALDLKKWLSIMAAYEGGGHAYHATMPTDALRDFRETINEMATIGFDVLKQAQWDLGGKTRFMLKQRGFQSVAADGHGAPGVVVSFAGDAEIAVGKPFARQGLQIAAGVPLELGEGADYRAFRIGLFGIDKLKDIDSAVGRLEDALDKIDAEAASAV